MASTCSSNNNNDDDDNNNNNNNNNAIDLKYYQYTFCLYFLNSHKNALSRLLNTADKLNNEISSTCHLQQARMK
jgi:hypothetical protein